MSVAEWFLSAAERRNPATRLGDWTEGNQATPLVHGSTYFAELVRCLEGLEREDLLMGSAPLGGAPPR